MKKWLIFIAVLLTILGVSFVSKDSVDLHGSCVFAIQEWHNPEYVKYCVPQELENHLAYDYRYSFPNDDVDFPVNQGIITPENNTGEPNNPNVPPVIVPDNNTGTEQEKTCKNGKDNHNRNGKHNCSGDNPNPNSGQSNTSEKKPNDGKGKKK